MTKRAGIAFLFLLCTSFIFSQGGIVRGNVFEKESGEPIIFGNVIIEGTTIGTTTDIDGFFSLGNVTPGTYSIMFTYIGFDTSRVTVNVKAGEIVYKSVFLKESSVQLGTVNVSARREQARSEVQISALSVTPKQIQSLPSTGGDADIAQYLQVLPGVISTGDQGGQIYIRGGSPVQNKILLDGMTIYNPFHSIGFFSVFETEIIKSVDVLTGGFNAEHGGRISAIIDIKTREGNRKKFGGLVSASPFMGKVLLEGPIMPLKEEGGGSVSFLLTGKHSYIDQTSKQLYKYATTNDDGLPFQFTDLYGKVSILSGNGSKLNIFGFNFKDNVNYSSIAEFDWDAVGGGASFNLIPRASSLIIGGTVAYSKYKILLNEVDQSPRTSAINGFNANLDFSYYGKNNEIKYGLEFNGFTTDFKFRNFLGFTFQQVENTTEIAGFIKYKHKWGGLIFEPSLRGQYYASLSDFSLEPRLGLKYNVSDQFRLKAAAGLYAQNLISTVNERDVVNLFVGFLSGPEEIIFKPGTRTPADDRLQKSIQMVAGFEYDAPGGIEFNVEGYFKDYPQLININRNKLSFEDPDYVIETGEAYGVDFFARRQTGNSLLWLTYSLGFVNRDDGEQVYPTIFDRRHNINLLTTYQFGRKNSWEAAFRWNYGSGFPFTLTQGFFGENKFRDGISTDYVGQNPDLGIIYASDRNSGRLPQYHRLDVSLKKKFEFTKYANLEVTLSVTNAYDRENIFYFDRIRYERVNQLPVLPSLGVKLEF